MSNQPDYSTFSHARLKNLLLIAEAKAVMFGDTASYERVKAIQAALAGAAKREGKAE